MKPLLGLLLAAILAACIPPAPPSEPTGWLMFSSVPSIRGPELSIAAPPGWHGELSDEPGVVLDLRGPEPESDSLSVTRITRIPTEGEEWLATVTERTGFPADEMHDEWLDLPGGRASHGTELFVDYYLFPGPEDTVMMLRFFFGPDLDADAEDLARNRAIADTFRFEPRD